MNPRIHAAIVALGLAALAPAQASDNILIVIADDLGVDHVLAYGEGAAPPQTTTIDAMAARGVLFRNAWAYPVCSPARACINTGRYGYRTGVGHVAQALLPLTESTLPEMLDAVNSGYAHAWIGKWHLGGNRNPTHPNDSGWSHFAGLTGGTVSDYYNWRRTVNGQSANSTTYTSTKMVDDALSWIQSQNQPWVCVLAFNAPHSPFHSPPAGLHSQDLTGQNPSTNPTPFYKAAVEALDTELGRLFTSLGSELDDTNVIFFGDNGTPSQTTELPFLRNHSKGTPYEGGVRVPFVVAGPAVASGGREATSVVSVVDMLATVGDLTGHDLRPPLVKTDSVSIVPYLSNSLQTSLRSTIYAESFTAGSNPLNNGFAVARNVDYKLIRNYRASGSVTEELYHLPSDPFETNDLTAGGLTASEQLQRDALAAHIDEVRNTNGSLQVFGEANCIGSNGPPLISGNGTPRLGRSYSVRLSQGASSQPAVLTIGAFDEELGGVPLPFSLQLIGAGPGCLLYTSAELTVPAVTDPTGNASITISLPVNSLLLGGSIFHTWLGIDPGAPSNPLSIVATQGLEAVPGA